MRRVILRALRRAVTSEAPWNGNRVPMTNFYRPDPEANIIRWTWVKYATYFERYEAAMRDPANDRRRFVRLRTPQEIDAFLAASSR